MDVYTGTFVFPYNFRGAVDILCFSVSKYGTDDLQQYRASRCNAKYDTSRRQG